MALSYHPVTWTGARPTENAAYYDGSRGSRAIDYAGSRLYRWVYTDKTLTNTAGNHLYDYYTTINPSFSEFAKPSDEYRSAELVVFDMSTRAEINRWTFPTYMSSLMTVATNSTNTSEANAFYTAYQGSPYTAATVYDIGPNWGTTRSLFPDFIEATMVLEGSDWIVSRITMFQHIANNLLPFGNVNYAYHLIAINVTTGESVVQKCAFLDGAHRTGGVVKVSASKYAVMNCNYDGTEVFTYVFDTSSKVWSKTTPYSTAGLNFDYTFARNWSSAPKNGTSGGSLFLCHRNSTLANVAAFKNLMFARLDLNSSGTITNWTALTSITKTVYTYTSGMFYEPSDDSLIVVRDEEYGTWVVEWLKLNASTGSTIATGNPDDGASNPATAYSVYGSNVGEPNPQHYADGSASGYIGAFAGTREDVLYNHPLIVSRSSLAATPWSVFSGDWTALEALTGSMGTIWSLDATRSGIWVDQNPDPESLDYTSMDWTLITHVADAPTMGLCFIEETATDFRDFKERFPG